MLVLAIVLTDQGVVNLIVLNLKLFNIDCEVLIGQGYDRAAPSSGNLHGAQAYVQQEYPMALYEANSPL